MHIIADASTWTHRQMELNRQRELQADGSVYVDRGKLTQVLEKDVLVCGTEWDGVGSSNRLAREVGS